MYNPDEPRDWRGRWTTSSASGSPSSSGPTRTQSPHHFGHGKNPPLPDLSEIGRATSLLVHASFQLKWAHRFPDVTRKIGERFAPVLAAWKADAGLSDNAFFHRYLDFDAGYRAVPDFRRAAALSQRATTFNEMADAAEPFAAAVRSIGSRHPWPPVMKRLEECATKAIEEGKVVLPAISYSPTQVANIGPDIWRDATKAIKAQLSRSRGKSIPYVDSDIIIAGTNWDSVARMMGVDPYDFSDALHAYKEYNNLGPADNITISPRTGQGKFNGHMLERTIHDFIN